MPLIACVQHGHQRSRVEEDIAAVSYDHQNLPLSLTSNGVSSSYRYDGSGQRITKQVAGRNTEVYVLDGASSLGVVTLNASAAPTSWFFNVLAGTRQLHTAALSNWLTSPTPDVPISPAEAHPPQRCT